MKPILRSIDNEDHFPAAGNGKTAADQVPIWFKKLLQTCLRKTVRGLSIAGVCQTPAKRGHERKAAAGQVTDGFGNDYLLPRSLQHTLQNRRRIR